MLLLTMPDSAGTTSGAECTDGSGESALKCVRSRLKDYLVKDPLQNWISARVPVRYEPFYSSFDLRDAGFKLAPVDANLYPAGFNNICSEDLNNSPELLRPHLERHLGRMPKRIAIFPESHTKNQFYVENLYELRQMFRRLGIETEVGWNPETPVEGQAPDAPVELKTPDERTVLAYPFERDGQKLYLNRVNAEGADERFEPEFIVVNNDMSSGLPKFLEGVEQHIEPSPRMGWHTRKKSDFFLHYNRLAGELAEAVGIDPWHVQVLTKKVEGVDFDENVGMDRIAAAVDEVIAETARQYAARGIDEKPFVFVKSNSGTYGMGILRVESGEELLKLNRRERNKMAVVKGKLQVHDVVVQEGIPTRFKLEGVYSEPVIYMLGHDLLGGFLRKNPTRGKGENLNAKGMVFQKLCISDLRYGADRDLELELVYGTIARLSAAAITLEIAKIEAP